MKYPALQNSWGNAGQEEVAASTLSQRQGRADHVQSAAKMRVEQNDRVESVRDMKSER